MHARIGDWSAARCEFVSLRNDRHVGRQWRILGFLASLPNEAFRVIWHLYEMTASLDLHKLDRHTTEEL